MALGRRHRYPNGVIIGQAGLLPRDVVTVAACTEGRLLMSTMAERVATRPRTRAGLWRLAAWWLGMVAGISEIVIAFRAPLRPAPLA
jgi:hypothetical protein